MKQVKLTIGGESWLTNSRSDSIWGKTMHANMYPLWLLRLPLARLPFAVVLNAVVLNTDHASTSS